MARPSKRRAPSSHKAARSKSSVPDVAWRWPGFHTYPFDDPEPTAPYLRRLLDKDEFWRDAIDALHDILLVESRGLPGIAVAIYENQIVGPFVQKWNALPPPPELILIDPKRRMGLTVVSGRWGVVPVFPWTTEQEIRAAIKRIRRSVGKIHRDSEGHRRALIAQWLAFHGASKQEIARRVWQRTKGLRRPSLTQAIAGLPEALEQELMAKHMAKGMTYQEAERQIQRAARGSEPPASAAVRMAITRLCKQYRALGDMLKSPKVSAEPISHAVTMILRNAYFDRNDAEAVRWVGELRDSLGVTPLLKP